MIIGLLLPHHVKLKAELEENMDMVLLRQQCDKGCLDVQRLSAYVLSVIERMCAPVRDEQVAKLKTETELVPLFRYSFLCFRLPKLIDAPR